MAELNGLEPSSAWLTTKCLTSRPQFLALPIGDCRLPIFRSTANRLTQQGRTIGNWQLAIGNWQLVIGNRQSPIDNLFWVGRRDLNPQRPQSQCGALPN